MTETIINKVAESGIITIDLAECCAAAEIAVFDIKDFLFKGLILKEKEFREQLKQVNWEQYKEKYIALTNSADAIIPMWAYMLVVSYLQPLTKEVVFGTEKELLQTLLLRNISAIDSEAYKDKRVVIKGCGDIVLPESAYVMITQKLRPVVRSLMFGEPCSTVPVYKSVRTIAGSAAS